MNISRIEVKLDEKVDKAELERISKEIRSSRESYDKVWISFYLPDFLPETGIGAWAYGNFTPELEVVILGEDKPISNGQKITFPHFATVIEMLNAANDYAGHNLEIISEKPLSIRVSKDFIKGDVEEIMVEQTKRDIIYVAFQAFAETDIDEITITSIPILRIDFNPNKPYDGKLLNNLKQTKTITRQTALKILEKYIKTKTFQDLYQLDGTMYLPNDKFNLLKFGQCI